MKEAQALDNGCVRKETFQRITARVPRSKKMAFSKLAKAQRKSEAAVLGDMIDVVLRLNSVPEETLEKEFKGSHLSFRFPLKAKNALGKLALTRRLTISEYIANVLLSHLTKAPAFTENEMQILSETNVQLAAIETLEKEFRGSHLSFRFPLKAKNALGKLALTRRLTVSEYSANVLLSHLTKAPAFTENEMQILRETNVQLAAIGRNINQIAKAINTSVKDQIKQDDVNLLLSIPMDELKVRLGETRQSVMQLAKANIFSWRNNDEQV